MIYNKDKASYFKFIFVAVVISTINLQACIRFSDYIAVNGGINEKACVFKF